MDDKEYVKSVNERIKKNTVMRFPLPKDFGHDPTTWNGIGGRVFIDDGPWEILR